MAAHSIMEVSDILVLNIFSGVPLVAAGVQPRVVQHSVEHDGVKALSGRITKELVIKLCRPTGRSSIVCIGFESWPHRKLVRLPSIETGASATDTTLHCYCAVNLEFVPTARLNKLH
ncbi:hypothetical protein ES703_48514 [subsurface metagenome]